MKSVQLMYALFVAVVKLKLCLQAAELSGPEPKQRSANGG